MNDYIYKLRQILMEKNAAVFVDKSSQGSGGMPGGVDTALGWLKNNAPSAVGALGGAALGRLLGGSNSGILSYAIPALLGGGLGYLYQNLNGNTMQEKMNTLSGYWDAFSRNGFSGLASHWAASNPDQVKKMTDSYIKNNPDQVRSMAAEYMKNNPDQVRSMAADYIRNNPDQVRSMAADYIRNNPEFLQQQMAGVKDVVKQRVGNMVQQYKNDHWLKGKFVDADEIGQMIDDNWDATVKGMQDHVVGSLAPSKPASTQVAEKQAGASVNAWRSAVAGKFS